MYYMFTCKISCCYEEKRGTVLYNNYIPMYNTYSLCFISTGKELRTVDQQTQVDKKQ